MLYLGIDSSAKTASVAIANGDLTLLSECYVNAGLTHSETLMPMLESALSSAKVSVNDIDVICVNAGPGSFTGIRIGTAAAKGLAFTDGKKCAAVSTLSSIARQLTALSCIACCAMDARCGQVYAAIFRCSSNGAERLCEDIAIPVEELYNMLKGYNERIVFAGDGAQICYDAMHGRLADCSVAPEQLRYQRAYGVILAAAAAGEEAFISAAALEPVYLRPPQAERELKLKQPLKGEL